MIENIKPESTLKIKPIENYKVDDMIYDDSILNLTLS